MGVDRFGNSHVRDLPYPRGDILRSTEDNLRKLQRAWLLIASAARVASAFSLGLRRAGEE
jgi:hypothetical protein